MQKNATRRKKEEPQVDIAAICKQIECFGADYVSIIDNKTELHVAVIRRPNAGKLYKNVRHVLGKIREKQVIFHVNPKVGEPCNDTHILVGGHWKVVHGVVPIEGLI